jgi:hypothetical protein
MASFELVRSRRIASRLLDLALERSALPVSVFFTSCWAMVEAPWTISCARRFAITARTMEHVDRAVLVVLVVLDREHASLVTGATLSRVTTFRLYTQERWASTLPSAE